jgi:hypothetical protein
MPPFTYDLCYYALISSCSYALRSYALISSCFYVLMIYALILMLSCSHVIMLLCFDPYAFMLLRFYALMLLFSHAFTSSSRLHTLMSLRLHAFTSPYPHDLTFSRSHGHTYLHLHFFISSNLYPHTPTSKSGIWIITAIPALFTFHFSIFIPSPPIDIFTVRATLASYGLLSLPLLSFLLFYSSFFHFHFSILYPIAF